MPTQEQTRRCGQAAIVAAGLLLLAAQPAWQVLDDLDGVDPSWKIVVAQACREHWAFGRDIVFTFGPYGHLYCRVPLDALATLALNTAAWACGLVALLRMLLSCRVTPPVAALVALAAFGCVTTDINAFYSLLPLLLGLHPWVAGGAERRLPRFDAALAHAAAGVMAMLCLVKFTFTISGAIGMVSLVAAMIARQRRPWQAATFAAALATLWFAAGQSWRNAAAFVATGVDIVLGFDAMALDSPGSGPREVLLAAAALLVAGLIAWRLLARRGAPAAIGAVCAALQLALVFKASIVRHDNHVLLGVAVLGAAALVVAGVWGLGDEPAPARRTAQAVAAAALACVVAVGVSARAAVGDCRWHVAEAFFSPITQLPGNLRQIADYPWTAARRAARWEAALAPVRREMPMRPVSGTVDIYLPRQAIAAAHGLDYRPRPVIQSYSAYTADLLALNRDHLLGAAAPRWLIYQPFQVNSRYVWLSDSLSWPVILTHYRPARLEGGRLLLAREDEPRESGFIELGSRRAAFGETVVLPTPKRAEALWARIVISESAGDRLRRLAYKSRPVRIEAHLQDGQSLDRRLVRPIAAAGFILSPCIEDARQYVEMATSDSGPAWTDRVVRAVCLRDGDDESAEGSYDLHLSLLHWDRPTAGE